MHNLLAKERKRARDSYSIRSKNRSSLHIVSVFRSNKNLHVSLQEAQGKCLLSISTNSKNAPENIKGHSNIESANWVGNELANKMQELNISKIVFNKSGYKFHGKIKAILDSIRNRGIEC
jgi:large subunit ribosomal protein L18